MTTTKSTLPFCQGEDWKPRPSTEVPGTCGACGTALTKRNHWFCKGPPGDTLIPTWASESCRARYFNNHHWGYAREAAIRRDGGKCRHCGEDAETWGTQEVRSYITGELTQYRTRRPAEVNHIDPRNGAGYGNGCHNHQDNLETLCHDCHLDTTKNQRRERQRPVQSPQLELAI